MDKKIIFMGSGDLAAIILKKIAASEFRPEVVFTQPDKPAGRKQVPSPSPAKKIAQNFDLKIFEPKSLKNNETKDLVKSFAPDLIIVADYGKIIPKNILDIPKYGALNIHPSLLPRHRGATPVHDTILSGDRKTGVSIILMDEQVDHGPIAASAEYGSDISKIGRIELTEKLAELGAELLIKILPEWFAEKIEPAIQNETLATYTKILSKDDGKIDWRKPAEEIERQIRAFEGWPGSWCVWPENNKKIKILRAEIMGITGSGTPGKVSIMPGGEMAVGTGSGGLKIQELQLEGKNKTTGKEFLRGYFQIIGKILN